MGLIRIQVDFRSGMQVVIRAKRSGRRGLEAADGCN
jgi:hypothetical protein